MLPRRWYALSLEIGMFHLLTKKFLECYYYALCVLYNKQQKKYATFPKQYVKSKLITHEKIFCDVWKKMKF